MDNNTLTGKKVAILVADGFEQVELTEPKRALEDAGARTSIVSPPRDGCRAGSTSTKPISSRST